MTLDILKIIETHGETLEEMSLRIASDEKTKDVLTDPKYISTIKNIGVGFVGLATVLEQYRQRYRAKSQ
jgi:hypothetical protein